MFILRWIDKMIDRIFVVLGALILMQMPLFMLQYHLSLQGHIKELEYQIDKMKDIADSRGKTLQEWIQKFIVSSDPDFSQQGKLMQEMITRQSDLSTAMQTWQKASVFQRPFVFLHHYQNDIVQETWKLFQLGIPINLEGLSYGLIGIFLGYMLYCTLSLTFRLLFGLFRRKPKSVQKTA